MLTVTLTLKTAIEAILRAIPTNNDVPSHKVWKQNVKVMERKVISALNNVPLLLFSGGSQGVACNKFVSKPLPLKYGVAQGSIPSPALFTLKTVHQPV